MWVRKEESGWQPKMRHKYASRETIPASAIISTTTTQIPDNK
jgi:hypothetical protein